MRFSLKQLCLLFAVISVVVFIASMPLVFRQRAIARGINYANETWASSAVIYAWPPPATTSGNRYISHHVDRESGLMIQNRSQSEFRDAYNSETNRLLEEHGPPNYSAAIATLLPTDAELAKMFSSGAMKKIESFPINLTDSIRVDFDGTLHIDTTGTEFAKGMLMGIGYNNPVYTTDNGSLIYIRSGNDWMGVFLPDGRLLFEVH